MFKAYPYIVKKSKSILKDLFGNFLFHNMLLFGKNKGNMAIIRPKKCFKCLEMKTKWLKITATEKKKHRNERELHKQPA